LGCPGLIGVKLNKFFLYCCGQGNVGDSRAVASISGRVEELSFDHKPSNELETKRIEAAGGWVEFNRVNGTHFILVKFLEYREETFD